MARQLRDLLKHDASVTVWDSGVFRLTQTAFESLLSTLTAFDFAVLLLTPDDVAVRRESRFRVARDNVIFELGLFLGSFGPTRTFVVCNRAVVRSIPSDLLGVTLATYEDAGSRETAKIRRSLNRAAREIRNALQSHVDRYEVDFLKAYLTFIQPPIDLVQTYSNIITARYDRIHSAVIDLQRHQDWAALLAVKERLGEYFEYQGRYLEGVEFGKLYVRALERQGRTAEALWVVVKHIAYLLVLSGDYAGGRRMFDRVLKSLSKLPETSSIRECRFYCYRYKGIAYLRDDVTHSKMQGLMRARECFAKAEQVQNTFPASSIKSKELRGRLLGNWGNLAQANRDFDAAVSYHTESLELFRRVDDKEHIGIALLQGAQARIGGELDLDKVEPDLDRAEEVFVDLGWVEGQGRVLQQRARLYEKLAQRATSPHVCQEYLQTATRCAKIARQRFESVQAHRLAGEVTELLDRLAATR